MKAQETALNGLDVVTFLKEQHAEVKGIFTRLLAAKSDQRRNAFIDLQRALTTHEAAEQAIVHPLARETLQNGEAIVAARLAEEAEAKKTLESMDRMDVDSAEFESHLRKLHKAVLDHADAEERTEFNPLAKLVDEAELERITAVVKEVEARTQRQAASASAPRV